MFLRALIAFIALPGVAAYLVPALIVARSPNASGPGALGLALMVAGSLVLLWCVRTFYVVGKGTLAPWAPPVSLVAGGLYRFTRNPMYVAVLLVLVGWATAFRSSALAVYAVAVALAFHLRVLLAEEPVLARMFPAEWQAYRRTVPRWLWPLSTGKRDAGAKGAAS